MFESVLKRVRWIACVAGMLGAAIGAQAGVTVATGDGDTITSSTRGDGWSVPLTLSGTTPEELIFGMADGATEDLDDVDQDVAMPPPGEAGAYFYRFEPAEMSFQTDIIGTAEAGEWLLVAQAGADDPVTVSWPDELGMDDGKQILLRESDQTGTAITDGRLLNMALETAFTVEAGEVSHYLVEYGDMQQYTVTFHSGDHGSLNGADPDTGDVVVTVTPGSEMPQTPDVTANQGWQFDTWEPELSGRIANSIATTAMYLPVIQTISAAAGEHGTISPDGDVQVQAGNSQVFTISPEDHYHIEDVLVDGESVGAEDSYEFTDVTEDHEISATFAIDTYTLTYTAGDNGAVIGDSPQTIEHGGDGTEILAEHDEGYHFVQWSDGVTDNPRTDSGVSGTVDVTAVFGINEYTVTFNPGDHGELEDGDPNVEIVVEHGQPAPTPPSVINVEDGWSFDSWDPQLPDTVVGDLSTTASYALTLDWEFTINVGGATPESLSFGMSSGATDGVDDGIDETMTMPAADQTGSYLYRTTPEQAYRVDIIGTAGSGEWFLVVQAGADNPVELSWSAARSSDFPDGKYLTMYEVDADHLPVGATARNMMVTQERTIDAGETAFLVIRFADTLVTDIALREAWNLISLPLEPVDPSVSALFDGTKVATNSERGPALRDGMRGTVYIGDIWTYYDKSYHTVTELEARVGYWVFAEEPATLLIEGAPPQSMDLVCKAGWNLLGPVAPMAVPTDNEHLRGTVWIWNADQQVYEPAETLYPCNGYWINARSETTITSKTGEDQVAVPEMVYVEAGTFTMGDTWGDGYSNETPTHDVTVSSFYMGKYEATNQQVADVFQWAYDNGRITADGSTAKNANGNSQELLELDASYCQISFSDGTFSVDDGKENYPCVDITWYGAAAYCNYLSEKEGRTPAYDFSDWNSCDWNADGYRLPTEAEWEYAARGGQADTDPGGDDAHKYAGSDENTSLDDVAWYGSNSGSHSHEVGTKAANELGIHDLSGNVLEWCWDWYGSGYYSDSPGTDPRGPGEGSYRVFRGGGWSIIARRCRVAYRNGIRPGGSSVNFGFRLVLPAGQ